MGCVGSRAWVRFCTGVGRTCATTGSHATSCMTLSTRHPACISQDELRDAVLLVFANKQDLPNAMNAAEITDKLGLHSLRQRHWYALHTRHASSGRHGGSRVCRCINQGRGCTGPCHAAIHATSVGQRARWNMDWTCTWTVSKQLYVWFVHCRYIQSTCATNGEGLYEGG